MENRFSSKAKKETEGGIVKKSGQMISRLIVVAGVLYFAYPRIMDLYNELANEG